MAMFALEEVQKDKTGLSKSSANWMEQNFYTDCFRRAFSVPFLSSLLWSMLGVSVSLYVRVWCVRLCDHIP